MKRKLMASVLLTAAVLSSCSKVSEETTTTASETTETSITETTAETTEATEATEETTEETTEVTETEAPVIVYTSSDPIISDVSDREKDIKFIRNGMEINAKAYLPEGEGPFPVVIMSCGMYSASTNYTDKAQRYAEKGYAAITFDFLNNVAPDGNPDILPDDFGVFVEDQVMDLYVILDSMEKLPFAAKGQVFLWGHSLGGLASAYVGCTRQSELAGMILVEPTLDMDFLNFPSMGTVRIVKLLADCKLDTVIFMGDHDGFGDNPHSYDSAIANLSSGELIIVEGANHNFEAEYGIEAIDKSCEGVLARNTAE